MPGMGKTFERRIAAGLGWAGLYTLLAAAPLGLALLGPLPEKRPWLVEFGVALGLLALSMMGLNFALSARVGALSRRLGQDTLLQFHRQTGLLAGALVLAHPAVLIAADPAYASFFDPRVNFLRAAALCAAVVAVAVLIGMAMLRPRLRVQYEWWRLSHAALGALLMVIGLAHVMKVSHYAGPLWKKGLFALLIAAPLLLLTHVRVVRPWLLRRRPFKVVEVRREGERVWTLALEPDGDHGLRFAPGQFAWVTIAGSPFGLRQHPFTVASSAERPRRIEFAIKELGDYTGAIGATPVGATAFLEGPAGSFTLPDGAARVVLVVGGIGVTPALSILRTIRDRADRRPATLLYATQTLEKAAFREELASLRDALALRVFHVLEAPPEGWDGPSGYVDAGVIRRCVTREDLESAVFLVCGPDAMMDGVEAALLGIGVAPARIRCERFSVV